MIIKEDKSPISSQSKSSLLGISKSAFYRQKEHTVKRDDELVSKLKQGILNIHEKYPHFGRRKIPFYMKQDCQLDITEKVARKLMKSLGIKAMVPGPHTSTPNPKHKKYPYLLRNLDICRPNQVWATDITYLKLPTGWVYLVAVIDWYSRKVLSWNLSNSLDTSFCMEALEEALKIDTPEIFNTDQGCQFTSEEFTQAILSRGIKLSMDGKGRALDNVIVERFWRSLKYEDIFLHAYTSMKELREAIGKYVEFFNTGRIHQALGYRFPADMWSPSKEIA